MDWAEICKDCKRNCCKKQPFFVSKTDQERIEKVAGEEDFIEEPYFMKKVEDTCIFYGKDLCKIYGVRPLDCKIYPIVFEIDGGLRFYVDLNCPYALKLDERWVEETKKLVREEIKSWSNVELLTYEKYCYTPRRGRKGQ